MSIAREGVNVLVIANETVLGEPLLERIRVRAQEGPASFLIVSPAERPDSRRVIPRPSGASVPRSPSCAPKASTSTVRSRTRTRTRRRCRRYEDERIDEIVVSTFPGERSGWLRRDLVGRLRSDSGLPVDHVQSESLGMPQEVLETTP